ncbi:MAG TPA: mercury methylation ferredoxin HgcB [Bacteroidales bacterium]|nr:mercury methylation ferredoxin HgcB [Bacteroidales bacterium]
MKDLVYLPDVVTLALDENKCTGCGLCIKVCPHNVFELSDRKAHIVRRDFCMECGACALNCACKAITVNSGVGCAAGIINGILKGTEPSCDCSGSKCC